MEKHPNRKNVQRVEVTKGSMTQIGRTSKSGGYHDPNRKNIQRVEVTKGSIGRTGQ